MERIGSATPFRLFKEILRVIIRHPVSLIFGSRIQNLEREEFIIELQNGVSLYRWGDGETAISRGKDISYQLADRVLGEKLRALVSLRDPRIIHGLPWVYKKSMFFKSWTRKKFQILFSTRIFLLLHHRKSRKSKYVDASIWYDLHGELRQIIEKLSTGKKKIVLVSSNPKFLTVCPNQTIFIEAPSKDTFSKYQSLCQEINSALSTITGGGHTPVILSAIGPASKALVLDYFQRCQVIDVGHGFDFAIYGYGKYAWTQNKSINVK